MKSEDRKEVTGKRPKPTKQDVWHRSVIQIACRWSEPVHWTRQGQEAPWHADTHTQQHQKNWNVLVAWVSIDTEAGMLSGISRKRSIRSNPYWFTEFCNSQCLSHFAAPFIVVRAETSVAESCIWCKRWRATQSDMQIHLQFNTNGSFTTKVTSPMPIHHPRARARGSETRAPNPRTETHKGKFTVN